MFFSLLQRAAVLASSVCCYRNKSILNSFIFTSFCEIGFISFPWLSHTPERALWDSDSAISGSVRTSYAASMIKGNGPHPYSKAPSSFQEDTSPWNDCHSQSITEMQLYPWSGKEQRSGWHSLEYHGHAGEAPQSTHQMSSALYAGRRITFIESPQRAACRLNSAQGKLLMKGEGLTWESRL